MDHLLYKLLAPTEGTRPLVVIDLSQEQAKQVPHDLSSLPLFGGDKSPGDQETILWNETIQALVIKRVLQGIRTEAERTYKEGRRLNNLVPMDEAHWLAPMEKPENQEKEAIHSLLIDAAHTTRKYGVGWMFISQRLYSLDSGIVEQLRIFFFGFGLGMGEEFRALIELVGGRGKALDLYQLFRNPHSTFEITSRVYHFMTIGLVSPLFFAGTPLFFNAFNTAEEFLEANVWYDTR
ncbi:hypothetical protein SAMN05660836_02235 [Thermodesulforhabdus norvegica]|uniref:Uncharacterized protein n=1 Tax=Thermodesulforhabdus norvegica TaxID=39841 RepID=A0A1I4VDQ7_9BACT|nr:hypothetical protein SAMN05660836_02235 [Thermodesulforhabdus norvegica]